uniref:Uncharacterized protein n=1 Tax=Aegilops tauschii subsp. strangulata TaxID=200361 RepID=A0A453S6U4_AEGTS
HRSRKKKAKPRHRRFHPPDRRRWKTPPMVRAARRRSVSSVLRSP